MKRKNITTIATICIASLVLAGCGAKGGNKESPTKETTNQETKAKELAAYDEDFNIIDYYDTQLELEEAIGFKVLVLPATTGYANIDNIHNMSVSTEGVAEVFYSKDGSEQNMISVRTAPGDEAPVSYKKVNYDKEEEKDGITIHTGEDQKEKLRSSWWSVGEYSFSMSGQGVDEETYNSCLQTLIEGSLAMK
ncbi:putative small lipoprotein YifL [Lachnospiraceae bacterium PM6-15]|uniref:DUF4367 domain-containing protein n=1 Tax=Ohessyouella blattaphilus TaxID=2949333 RepID=A0ABT1EKH4_9FIRM|nr:hypothetical protein [Ohessyouella blattaphilus]MCP1111178.1 hypothetical protein [Ohessyouella blattaphilus]MCR8564572.1 hypothetical protein [Ohessyouella blattaphilus]